MKYNIISKTLKMNFPEGAIIVKQPKLFKTNKPLPIAVKKHNDYCFDVYYTDGSRTLVRTSYGTKMTEYIAKYNKENKLHCKNDYAVCYIALNERLYYFYYEDKQLFSMDQKEYDKCVSDNPYFNVLSYFELKQKK